MLILIWVNLSWFWCHVLTPWLPITRLPWRSHSDAMVLGRCGAVQQWAASPPAAVCHRDVQCALRRLRRAAGIQWPPTLLHWEVGQSHITTQVSNPVCYRATFTLSCSHYLTFTLKSKACYLFDESHAPPLRHNWGLCKVEKCTHDTH